MTNDTVKITVLLSMLLLLFVGNAFASENESISSENNECSACHNTNVSTQPAIATQAKCNNCHGRGHGSLYAIGGREDYHRIHNGIDRSNRECARCHHTPDCSACHTNHILGNESCSSCHGSLPSPNSHAGVRNNFSSGNHSWMESCNTCHSGDKLKAGPYIVDLNESNDLCDICHSTQMNNMSQGKHGEDGNKCVVCHNPHTTYSVGSAIFASDAVDSSWHSQNGTSIIDDIKMILFSKNGFIIAIICALGITLVSHRLMPEHGKDMGILAGNLITIHDKEHIEVVHIKISDLSVVDKIFDSIERMDVKVLSAAIKKPKRDILEIFLDFSVSTTSKEELLKNVNEFGNVICTEYFDDYNI